MHGLSTSALPILPTRACQQSSVVVVFLTEVPAWYICILRPHLVCSPLVRNRSLFVQMVQLNAEQHNCFAPIALPRETSTFRYVLQRAFLRTPSVLTS